MVPVVMLTSSREEQDLVRSYQLGVSAYVVKPVDFQRFLSTVKELGLFWAVINEPPPGSGRRHHAPFQDGAASDAAGPASTPQ